MPQTLLQGVKIQKLSLGGGGIPLTFSIMNVCSLNQALAVTINHLYLNHHGNDIYSVEHLETPSNTRYTYNACLLHQYKLIVDLVIYFYL